MTYANYLELFNHVLTHGEKVADKTTFNKLTAWHDIDGYTCYLGFEDVTLTLLFHSRFTFDYQNKTNLSTFQAEIEQTFALIQQQRLHNKREKDEQS
ncbi:DUF3081 domain-containing protein [Psychrosphaera sp. F3M07]|uniref:DUF3081 family protein n=1 Tax=Psychrosphaera sp. F3M07 TaxID=2841560 RepID=UPI001C084AC8|nr:DUF3081 family protein [Psychrosphaera sp. F3M07]MBU2918161.1 DUF3081 domain-containing protein [Psychrosphaera sp. F3M07]